MIGDARRSLARALVASGGFFSLHLGDLPRHAESFDERRRGVDRSAVVVVAVLAVAEQDGVDTEFDDGHEDVRDDEGKQDDDDDDEERGRNLFVTVVERVGVEHQEGDRTRAQGDDQLAEDEHDVADDVDCGDGRDVLHHERQGVPGRVAEGRAFDGGHDVRVAVQPLDRWASRY